MRLRHALGCALLLMGCADSTQFTEGTVSVWRLDDAALVFGSFRTDPADCEAVRVGACEDVLSCRDRLSVVSAGTMSVRRGDVSVGTDEPNADGLYLFPVDEGGDAGDRWVVGFEGAEVEPFELAGVMPPAVGALAASRDGAIRLEWEPPANVDEIVVDVSSPTDPDFELQCVLGGAARSVVVDAALLDGASNLSASVTAYALDREGGVTLRVGDPARIAVP